MKKIKLFQKTFLMLALFASFTIFVDAKKTVGAKKSSSVLHESQKGVQKPNHLPVKVIPINILVKFWQTNPTKISWKEKKFFKNYLRELGQKSELSVDELQQKVAFVITKLSEFKSMEKEPILEILKKFQAQLNNLPKKQIVKLSKLKTFWKNNGGKILFGLHSAGSILIALLIMQAQIQSQMQPQIQMPIQLSPVPTTDLVPAGPVIDEYVPNIVDVSSQRDTVLPRDTAFTRYDLDPVEYVSVEIPSETEIPKAEMSDTEVLDTEAQHSGVLMRRLVLPVLNFIKTSQECRKICPNMFCHPLDYIMCMQECRQNPE